MDIKQRLRLLARRSHGVTRASFAETMIERYRDEIIAYIHDNLFMVVSWWVQEVLRKDGNPVTADDARAGDALQLSFHFPLPTWLVAAGADGQLVSVLGLDATADEWDSSAIVSEGHAAAEAQNARNKREVARFLRAHSARTLREFVAVEA